MIKALQDILEYQFQNISLLEEALSHPSLRGSQTFLGKDYERLEFLGDSVISLIITDVLYHTFLNYDEGDLARMRSYLVSKEFMTKIAGIINIGECIIMSSSEEVSGGRDNANNLENVLESVIGAVYLDGGIEIARKVVIKFWQPYITKDIAFISDPKSMVQEILQERKLGLPQYEIYDKTGPAHAPIFTVIVKTSDSMEAYGIGKSLKSAEKDAATKLMSKLHPGVKCAK
jgi:ribonuclease III